MTKLQLALKLIEKYDELIELYWPCLDVKSPKDHKLISDIEAEIASLTIQMNN